VALKELDEFGRRFGGLVELGDEPIEGFVRQDEVLMLANDALGTGSDRVEHSRGDSRFLEAGGLAHERVLVGRNAYFQPTASGRRRRGIAHRVTRTIVRTPSGQQSHFRPIDVRSVADSASLGPNEAV
jgi:hypothetical protein